MLTGQSLIRAAELRSVTTEYNKFYAGIQTFRDKYFALPGDMTNAYAYWGASCGTDAITTSTGCNGNGDGLVEGSFDGTHVGGVLTVANVPASKFSRGYWDFTDYGHYVAGSPPSYPWPNLTFGTPAGDVVLSPNTTLKREEAWNLDVKMDDGRSNSGKLHGYYNTASYNCSDASATDPYSLAALGSNGAGQCRLSFVFN